VGRPLWREDGSVCYICCWCCQRSLSRVWVHWDSRPYFIVSDLRLPFSSPPMTRRLDQSQSHLWLTVSQAVGLGVEPHLELMTRYLLLSWQLRYCFLWDAISDERTGCCVVLICFHGYMIYE
jgi:hypothetical protein